MKRITVILAGAIAAVAALAGPSAARPDFSGNICGLLKASQLQAVEISASCKLTKTANLPTATIYGAVWSDGPGLKDNRLSVQVWKSANGAFAAMFKKEAHGTPVKIGTFARAEISYGGENLYILAKGYGLLISLNHWADSTATNIGEIGTPMAVIGKTVASKLT